MEHDDTSTRELKWDSQPPAEHIPLQDRVGLLCSRAQDRFNAGHEPPALVRLDLAHDLARTYGVSLPSEIQELHFRLKGDYQK